MLLVLINEIMPLCVIWASWQLGQGVHTWSRQGKAPPIHYFSTPGWLNLLCGYATDNEQLALSGLLIQGNAWLCGIMWLLLPVFKVSADLRAAVFLISLVVSVLTLLTLAVWQAIRNILKKS